MEMNKTLFHCQRIIYQKILGLQGLIKKLHDVRKLDLQINRILLFLPIQCIDIDTL